MEGPNPVLLGIYEDGWTLSHTKEYETQRKGKNICKDTARSYHLQAKKRSSEETKPTTSSLGLLASTTVRK